MNYKHSFHAGNFADVMKHIVYMYTIDYFKKKESPFFILDTHGGAGMYDLSSDDAMRTQEALRGVCRLDGIQDISQELKRYVDFIQPYLQRKKYPGSPCIAASLLRSLDVLRVSELHPEVCAVLKNELRYYAHAYVSLQDGYEALRAYLPPKEKRGIVLIDPPYEREDEFVRCAEAMVAAYRKFSTGTYIVWYPMKHPHKVTLLQDALDNLPCGLLEITIEMQYAYEGTLHKAGLMVLRPPYLLQEYIMACKEQLESMLSVRIGMRARQL